MLPPSASLQDAELYSIFDDLTNRINALAITVEANRRYDTPDHRPHARCTLVCKNLEGPARLDCVRQCADPVIPYEDLQDFMQDGNFAADLTRLNTDVQLKRTFERHQRASDTIGRYADDKVIIPDMYAMPIATVALPDSAWEKAMILMTDPGNKGELHELIHNWRARRDDYPQEAKDELIRKLSRHDKSNVIYHALTPRSST